MGNREQLLDGAKQALVELGYARSTAREIASRAGTSLAAIGYHFGSTEDLLRAAISDGFCEWRAQLARVLIDRPAGGEDALRAIGAELDRLFTEQRRLFAVFLEAIAMGDRQPNAVSDAAAGYAEDRVAIAALIQGLRGESRREDTLLASTMLAVVDGLIIQHLLSRDAPTPSSVIQLLAPLVLATDASPLS